MSKRRQVRRAPPPVYRPSPLDVRRAAQYRRRPAGGPSLARRFSDELRAASPLARGLLLIRIFFGVTFVYAGLDKLLDANFFNPAAATSIQAQFAIFERVSPLAPLVRLAEPLAIPLGILIALGEIGAGLGALTGLCFRLAALGGASLSLMFYLTASWSTRPYYLGPDLPYACGWLALLIAGSTALWVPKLARPEPAPEMDAAIPRATGRPALSRRQLVQLGALTGLTLAVGSAAASLRVLLPGQFRAVATPTPSAGPSPSPVSTAGGTPTAAVAANGIPISTVSAVQQRGFINFVVPATAPANLFPTDPAVLVALAGGTFAAYDAVCTHEGCTVDFDAGSDVLFCPCHGAVFDPTNHAKVLQGPARRALPELPLVVDPVSGTISLAIG